MSRMSKTKGSTYERHIAKKLGAWWGEEFQRTPASGGLRWKQDNRVCGDIVTPPGSTFPWVVECKKRENWTMDSLLNGSAEVSKWWKQVTDDAERSGLEPMLIFTRNRQPDYVALKAHDEIFMFINPTMMIVTTINGDEVHIMRLDELIEMHEKVIKPSCDWVD